MTPQAPQELQYARQWLEEVFARAGEGLPLPEQAALRVIEQGLAAAMMGAALGEVWRLQALHRQFGRPEVAAEWDRLARGVEALAFGPLAPLVGQAWDSLGPLGEPWRWVAGSWAQPRRAEPAGTPRVVR